MQSILKCLVAYPVSNTILKINIVEVLRFHMLCNINIVL